MGFAPNPGQKRVVSEPMGELFVSAGAGTGKTASLTRRFVSAAADLDRVLTITFTDKAAGELIDRIRDVLLEDGRVEDARAVDSAWVSTIHGFCRRVLRRYALEAEIDPYFGVFDEVAARALAEECFESTTAALMASEHGIEDLVLAYGLEIVRSAVMDVHARVRHLGRAVTDLTTDPPPDAEATGRDALKLLRQAAATLADARPGKLVDRNTQVLQEATAALSRDESGPEALADAAMHLAGLTSSSGELIREAVGLGREARDLVSGAVAAHDAAAHTVALVRLIVAFDQAYAAAKAERGGLDFEDLQSCALALLERRPDIAARYREHFRAVMVDEFQDTDALQLRVIEQVSGANLCTVGDEFQSIYGFRCADVEVFRGRARQAAEDAGRARLELNYRSDPAVLAAVNEMFGSQAFFGARFERLEPGIASEPACDADELPHVQMLLTDHRRDHEATARQGEAAALAGRIGEILRAGKTPSDIVILLRALTGAGVYADALAAQGISAHIEGGGAFYEQDVVAQARCLLRAVANPLDEEALAAVLAGSASALSDDALYLLATGGDRTAALWDRLAQASELPLSAGDAAEAARLHRAITGLRTTAGRLSVSRTLRTALREVGLDAAVSADGSGLADLEKLVRIAEEYQRRDAADLSGFLVHLSVCERHARREPRAMEAAPEDAVRIMSVHRAKGLEFPVVVVADLGRSGRSDRTRALVSPRDDRVVLALVAPKEGERAGAGAQTPAFAEMLEARAKRAAEEGDRILYVACTRAERMLVLSGATDMSRGPKESADIDKFRAALHIGTGEPGSFDIQVGDACARVTVVDADEAAAALAERKASLAIDAGPGSVDGPSADRDRIGTPTERPVPPAVVDEFDPPATVSFTDLDAYRRCPYRWWLTRRAKLPEPWGSGHAPDPRALGTAVHAVLQIGADREEQAAIARHERLDAEGVQRLERAAARFRSGSLAARLARARHVSRELPFALPLDGTVLVGAIDAIGDEEDRVLIVDYKTGTPDAGPGEPLSASRRLQAACYALVGRERGADVVEVVFAYVEHDDADRSIELDRPALERALAEQVQPLLSGMRSGEVAPRAAYDAVLCRSCPGLDGLCQRRP